VSDLSQALFEAWKKTALSENFPPLMTKSGDLPWPSTWEKFPLFWFHLFLSYKCTRRCEYCYAFNQAGDDNVMEMDDRTYQDYWSGYRKYGKSITLKLITLFFLGGNLC
jgi:uncharacterized protein